MTTVHEYILTMNVNANNTYEILEDNRVVARMRTAAQLINSKYSNRELSGICFRKAQGIECIPVKKL